MYFSFPSPPTFARACAYAEKYGWLVTLVQPMATAVLYHFTCYCTTCLCGHSVIYHQKLGPCTIRLNLLTTGCFYHHPMPLTLVEHLPRTQDVADLNPTYMYNYSSVCFFENHWLLWCMHFPCFPIHIHVYTTT